MTVGSDRRPEKIVVQQRGIESQQHWNGNESSLKSAETSHNRRLAPACDDYNAFQYYADCAATDIRHSYNSRIWDARIYSLRTAGKGTANEGQGSAVSLCPISRDTARDSMSIKRCRRRRLAAIRIQCAAKTTSVLFLSRVSMRSHAQRVIPFLSVCPSVVVSCRQTFENFVFTIQMVAQYTSKIHKEQS